MDTDLQSPKRSNSHSSARRNKNKKPKPVVIPEDTSSNELVIVVDDVSTPQSIAKPLSSTSKPSISTPKIQINQSMPSTSSGNSNNNNSNKKRKKRDSASSDEERWLTAIESGKLEDVDDELKKIKPKDPALMTARQRAMYDRGNDANPSNTNTLMSLPTGYKEKVMTAEAIQKAAIKSLKRKQLADEKREKDKKKTMERLLKKQDSKAAKQAKAKIAKSSVPAVLYKQTLEGTWIVLPENMDFPIKVVTKPEPKGAVLCGMGCGNLKKYSCSKTGVPLCSLECYKRNMAHNVF